MKVFLKVLCLLLINCVILGVSGCMNKEQSVVEKMVSYMNGKYDDTFEYSAPFGGGASAKSKQINVKSQKMPDCDIWVEYSYETMKYEDNYIDYLYKTQVENYLKSNIEEVFTGDIKVARNIPTAGVYADYAPNTSFEEYINTSEQRIFFTVVACGYSDDKKDIIEKQISDTVEKYDAVFLGNVYFVDKANDIEGFLEKTTKEKDSYTRVIVEKQSKGYTKFDWR